jgi:hypothetical protein
MNSPATILPSRHDPLAADAKIMLAVRREASLRRAEIVVADLIFDVAGYAAVECAPRTDNLLALARNPHS